MFSKIVVIEICFVGLGPTLQVILILVCCRFIKTPFSLRLFGPSPNLRADLQILDSGATAKDILGLVIKQLASLGVPYAHNFVDMKEMLGHHLVHGSQVLLLSKLTVTEIENISVMSAACCFHLCGLHISACAIYLDL